MKYKHTNKGLYPIRIWDSENKDYSLLPGEQCIIDVEIINGDLQVEKIEDIKKTKKKVNKEDN